MTDSRAIGLDIGATKTLGVLVDAEGRVLRQVREATEPGADGVVRTAEFVVAHLGAAASVASRTCSSTRPSASTSTPRVLVAPMSRPIALLPVALTGTSLPCGAPR